MQDNKIKDPIPAYCLPAVSGSSNFQCCGIFPTNDCTECGYFKQKSYVITDEIPKEGDYGINPGSKKNKPRLVERASETNDTLGFKQPNSWFTWQPLRDYHRKVVFE